MADSSQEGALQGAAASGESKALAVVRAADGIKTTKQFANVMTALMSDLLEGTVTPQVGNAVCNAGGKLLKVVEMTYQYGKPPGGKEDERVLMLAE